MFDLVQPTSARGRGFRSRRQAWLDCAQTRADTLTQRHATLIEIRTERVESVQAASSDTSRYSYFAVAVFVPLLPKCAHFCGVIVLRLAFLSI
jgi:hypothetical protein